MADVATMARPQRWDLPFDPNMDEAALSMLLSRPEFSGIDAGDIVIREGDYGNSAFLILKGASKAIVPPGFPSEELRRSSMRKRGMSSALSQLWRNSIAPEVRDTSRYARRGKTHRRPMSERNTFRCSNWTSHVPYPTRWSVTTWRPSTGISGDRDSSLVT